MSFFLIFQNCGSSDYCSFENTRQCRKLEENGGKSVFQIHYTCVRINHISSIKCEKSIIKVCIAGKGTNV